MTYVNLLSEMYVFEQKSEKALSRLELVQSAGCCPAFEGLIRNHKGCGFVYISENVSNKGADRSEYSIHHGRNISGMYATDIQGKYRYGDVRDSGDAILFDVSNLSMVNGTPTHGSTLTIYIARGQAADSREICTLACDGELDEEMAAIKERMQVSTNTTL